VRAIIDVLQMILSTIVNIITLPFRALGRLLGGAKGAGGRRGRGGGRGRRRR
jgi:hypothetical protein